MRDLPLLPGRLEAFIGGHLLRLLLLLPEPVLRRLAGTPPPEAAGLHPEALLIARLAAIGPDRMSDDAPVAEQRRRLALQTRALARRPATPPTVTDHRAGDVPVRLYVPRSAETSGPLLVYFHGGGWVQGSVATHDGGCRLLSDLSGVRVLSVDYRLAPEHPYPAAVEDAIAAYRWAAANAPRLGADPTRLAVGGDSAGGNLAAVVALAARDDATLPAAAFQLLLYPVTDMAEPTESRRLFSEGFFLTSEFMRLAERSYLPAGQDPRDPRVSVAYASVPSGLAPAHVVTAGFDPLRDEGESYAARLAAADVPVSQVRYPGFIHGFANVVGAGRSQPAAVAEIAARLRSALS
jgi:acetyl esterase/lipase